MSTRGEGSQPKGDSCGQEDRGSAECDCPNWKKKKKDAHFLKKVIWKYFQSNINLIFEYSVLDKIRLDCKVYPNKYTNVVKYTCYIFDFCK